MSKYSKTVVEVVVSSRTDITVVVALNLVVIKDITVVVVVVVGTRLS